MLSPGLCYTYRIDFKILSLTYKDRSQRAGSTISSQQTAALLALDCEQLPESLRVDGG